MNETSQRLNDVRKVFDTAHVICTQAKKSVYCLLLGRLWKLTNSSSLLKIRTNSRLADDVAQEKQLFVSEVALSRFRVSPNDLRASSAVPSHLR